MIRPVACPLQRLLWTGVRVMVPTAPVPSRLAGGGQPDVHPAVVHVGDRFKLATSKIEPAVHRRPNMWRSGRRRKELGVPLAEADWLILTAGGRPLCVSRR